MAANNIAALQQYQDNLCRILVLVSQVINNPTQDNIDAVVAGYTAAQQTQASEGGLVVPKPTTSIGGRSYDWTAYRQSVEASIREAQRLIVMLGGSYIVRSRGMV